MFFCEYINVCYFYLCCMFIPRCMECRRGLAMRILSVCLSVKRVHCDKTEKKSVQIFYTIRKII